MLSLQVATASRQAIRLMCGTVMGRYHSGLKTIDLLTTINYVF